MKTKNELPKAERTTRAGGRRAEGLALSACGAAAAVCAVLLFQHYFVGPVCMVP